MRRNSTVSERFNHRGKGTKYPECSIHALRTVLESDAAGILLDIRLTADLRWVVPLYTDERAILRIHSQNFSRCKSVARDLDEVFALFAAFGEGKLLLLDVRDHGEYRHLKRMIQRHDLERHVVLLSWDPLALRNIHDLFPTVRLGICIPVPREEGVRVHARTRRGKVVLRFSKDERFRGWRGIRPSERLLPELPGVPLWAILAPTLLCKTRLVRTAEERGVKVLAFIVNRKITENLLRRNGVRSIVTDTA